MTKPVTPTPLIRHHAAADAIADALINGIRHPGNPDTKEPAAVIALLVFNTKGRPPQMVEAARNTAHAIGEACIHLIEHDLNCSIVPNSELKGH